MTKGTARTEPADLKALLAGDEDYLRGMIEAIVQAEMEELRWAPRRASGRHRE
jgi:hypothetical protein